MALYNFLVVLLKTFASCYSQRDIIHNTAYRKQWERHLSRPYAVSTVCFVFIIQCFKFYLGLGLPRVSSVEVICYSFVTNVFRSKHQSFLCILEEFVNDAERLIAFFAAKDLPFSNIFELLEKPHLLLFLNSNTITYSSVRARAGFRFLPC